MRGDTIVARFASRDSAGTQRAALSRIDAHKGAQSYHIEPNQQAPARPSINYARGDASTVTMKDSLAAGGGVDRVDIRGQVDGIQLEAAGDSVAAPRDSTPAGRASR